jgi:hypothetical protein
VDLVDDQVDFSSREKSASRSPTELRWVVIRRGEPLARPAAPQNQLGHLLAGTLFGNVVHIC